ncbi:NAD(P)-binding domain-containing protein [Paenisporosarcina quisquiliarum]|uniref:NAD(P)-binding domain-containing protein n=1 Tax=Paenisporosarcina quisquiliarum TaxID=365346 RepID=A0A9X3LGA8_9BACL|nr:NAD(P)-binding domain-containing protein [Paenisporosarcina quisquiliarum]MCZ8536869.1 NAD(P)-binding domain-containing protein [Paenisporosarcina quisquiliarum]
MTNEKMNFNILTNCCSSPKSTMEAPTLPTVIIGAGPVGLAAAAHLAAKNEPFLIIEVGPTVGHNILKWGHVRLFSPWQYNIDKVALKLLEESRWKAPVMKRLPFGKDLVEDYLIPLANLPQIKPLIKFNAKVVAISKQGLDKMKDANRDQQSFILYIEQDGNTERIEAKAVIDASGTWAQPNPVNADNVWTKGEESLSTKITYGIPNIKGTERTKFEQKRVAVVGGGHSAINTILELAELDGTEIVWILRKNRVEEVYGGEARDALPARGQLGSRIHQLVDSGKISVHTPFLINEIVQDNGKLMIHGTMRNEKYSIDTIDEIISNTGSRPDFNFLREIRLDIDAATESVSALAPLIDPNIHSCGTVRPHGEAELRQPEKNFYIVGVKSYGRAPTFLMATGYEQIRSIVAHLTGDQEAAKRVELDLPETGVCSTNIGGKSSCC